MKMNPTNERKTGRPKRRLMKVVKDDLKVVGLIEEDAMDRERWKE